MSSNHPINSDELSEPAAALIEKVEAALDNVQTESEVRTWFRRREQHWVEEQMPHLQKVLLTPIGKKFARICESEPIDGFYEYVRDQWRRYLT